MAPSSAFACAGETPSFRRPPMNSHVERRDVKSDSRRAGMACVSAASGTQRSAFSSVVPWTPSGATPATVKGKPLMRTCCPAMF